MGWRSSRLETDADIDSTYTVDLVFPLVPALIDPWQGVAVVDVFEDTGMVVVRMAMRDATLSDRAAVSGFTSSVLAPLPEGASR